MPPGHEYPVDSASSPAEAPVEKKGWVHKHPYLAALVAALALLTILLSTLAARSGVSANPGANNWVGTGSIFSSGGGRTADEVRPNQGGREQQSDEPELGYIPIATPSNDGTDTSFGNDLTALLALLAQPTATGGGNQIDSTSVFSFIPQGFISIVGTGPKRTPGQEALHSYGNNVGTQVQAFESMHTNSPQILKDHAEDRGNAEKIARVDKLGYEMAEFGYDLGLLDPIPAEVKAAHAAFATSYRLVGTNLTKIASTKSDQEFIDAVLVYNQSVEALSRRFFILASTFSTNEVTFSPSEPGSVFMFTPSSSF